MDCVHLQAHKPRRLPVVVKTFVNLYQLVSHIKQTDPQVNQFFFNLTLL